MTLHALATKALAAAALLAACTVTQPAAAPEGASSASVDQSILVSSSPAAGSTVAAPIDALMLHFSPPARLMEVTVTGPEGTMPMMVTPAGEAEHYSLPLSGLGAGSYTVAWRATAAGEQHAGSFGFAVR